MDCKKIRPIISLYLDNSLNSKQKRVVESHLLSCQECKQYLAELQQTIKFIRDKKCITLSEDFYTKLEQRLDEENVNISYHPLLKPVWAYTRIAVAVISIIIAGITVTKLNLSKEQKLREKNVVSQNIVATDIQKHKIVKTEQKEKSEDLITKQTKHSKPILDIRKEVNKDVEDKLNPEVKQELAKAAEDIQNKLNRTQTTKDDTQKTVDAMYELVAKGVNVENAQRTIETAIDKGYSGDKINEMVTTPQKSTVFQSPKLVENQSQRFKFEEISPNPFTPDNDSINDKVGFKYSNPENLDVTIKIFDLNGTVVKDIDIVPNEQPVWDGTNNQNVFVEGGLYLYVLKSGDTTIRGTIILAK